MKLHFIGADHEVTGSLHFLEVCGLNILVDCGMEQGRNYYENAELPVPYSDVDYILLTHAHIDHAGMIPSALRKGFNGTVLTTNATKSLSEIMLRDSAYIQMQEAEWRNRKAMRAGQPKVEPIYDLNDAAAALEHFRGVPYHEMVELGDGLEVCFIDAGHLLGSASIVLHIEEDGIRKTVVFSGDIGNFNKPMIRDPEYIEEADYVIMESTYGDRLHETSVDHIADLVSITQRTLDRGGNVILPAFAVGRTQELLYLYRKIKLGGMISGHDGFPVYVDSPLAVDATHVFTNNLKECYDDETRAIVEAGQNPIAFRGLKLSITLDESKAINFDDEPKVIISASGMCDAGRIRHHIKHNVWRPESTIVFAGYQAEGTLGRLLLDGAEEIRLFGEDFTVRAEIATMPAMSSHADQQGLLKWIGAFRTGLDRVFLVHGEDRSMEVLSGLIREQGRTVDCPYSGSVFDLAGNTWITEADPVPYEKEKHADTGERLENGRAGVVSSMYDAVVKSGKGIEKRRPASDAQFQRLEKIYEKLGETIRANYGGANRDLARFASQLQSICDKWAR